LHILHSWGGGLEKWVADYCHADQEHENFILKSIGDWGAFGMELHLYRHIEDAVLLEVWPLVPSIRHTAAIHSGYQAALAEIIDRYAIDAVFISSLIGHSLDALEAGAPTVMICHDFYPFCPALNITFGSICQSCGEEELMRCTESNPHHRFFRNVPYSDWVELREQFAARVMRRQLTLVAPSPSVRDHYTKLLPELKGAFQIIPHGVKAFDERLVEIGGRSDRRLQIVVLGSLAPHKGLDLLKAVEPQLGAFADLFLVGCGEYGQAFQGLPRVKVIPQFNREELPGLLSAIRPDLGLLLSVVPETFSYTLQELMELGVPPVATRVGSFADFIEDGVTGFLADPTPASVMGRVQELNADRRLLKDVRATLSKRSVRRLRDMCADYERLLNLPSYSARAYFVRDDMPCAQNGAIRRLQLMWRDAEGVFSESESVRCQVRADESNRVAALTIPPRDKPPVEPRLDLGEQPGVLVLKRVELQGATGQSLWRWDNTEGLIQGPKSGIEFLGSGGLVYLSNSDPHWILPVKDGLELLEKGGRLEIEFHGPSLQGIRGGPSENGKGSNPQRMAQQLTEARVRIADLEGSLSWRITRPLRLLGSKILKWVGPRAN
jgi:glycosyltransferase involved in cell wall biosynthesis